MKQEIKKWVVIAISCAITLWLIWATYAALSSLTATTWETLTVSKWDSLVEHAVPSGFVWAFDLENCPTWWSEYTALQWKFIRWADTWNNNDPDFSSRVWWTWVRKIWSTQEDAYQNHKHHRNTDNVSEYLYKTITTWTAAAQSWASNRWQWLATTWNSYDGNFSTETRPKNVALLYCIKD